MLTEKVQTLTIAIAGMLFFGFVQSIRGFLGVVQFLSQRENITEGAAVRQIIEFQARLSMAESLSLYLNILGVLAILLIAVFSLLPVLTK